MNLLSKLRAVADLWVVVNQRTAPSVSLKTLGARLGNSKLWDRPQMNVATYERVLLWLGDPANWPAAMVPEEACRTLRDLGVAVPAQHWLKLPVAA